MKTYRVGGAVRDTLLGYPHQEIDWVVVGSTPEQMTAAGYTQVGRDFPVFLHPDTKEEYALARTERKSGPGYHGFTVHADPSVTLEEDLERRDLTINAMAMDGDGVVTDPYGGQADLDAKILRPVSTHFVEDPLRVLRVARFAARYHHLGFIVWSSGSGKSTLLNILGLLDAYDGGQYRLDGKDMAGLSERRAAELRREMLGFVFQSFNLIPFKSAAENVALPLYYQKVPRKERARRSHALLERVGLLEWADHLPSQMSGGQKQRVAIARALAASPRVILADEPTGALDSATSEDVMALLKELNGEGMTMVVVTHEAEIAAACGRTIRLRDGLVESQGHV